MRRFAAFGIVLLVFAQLARGQITRVATFENFAEGQSFKPSFTDPLSGITLRDSTHPSGGFSIEYSSTEFGGGNYLTAGGYAPGPGNHWGANFGFIGDLSSPANNISVDVSYPGFGDSGSVVLKGYDSVGTLIAQQAGAPGAPGPFTLTIHSSQFDIVKLQVTVDAIDTGYDNVSYTILPEPHSVSLVLAAAVLALRRRWLRCSGRSKDAGRPT